MTTAKIALFYDDNITKPKIPECLFQELINRATTDVEWDIAKTRFRKNTCHFSIIAM